MPNMNKLVIAVDFDGTIVNNDKPYPYVGTIKPEAIRVIKKYWDKYIWCLWTCRSGDHLQMALDELKKHDIEFQWVNDSPGSGSRRKIIADLYIDDRAFPNYLNWYSIDEYLE